MSRKKKIDYEARAKDLRLYGFKVVYGTRKKGSKSSAAKAAVTRKWKHVSKYTENTKQLFVFRKLSKRERSALQGGVSDKLFTPNGFFLRMPRGCKGPPSINVRQDGVVEYMCEGEKGGRVREEIHRIDPELLLEDPPKAILALAKKKDKVILTVNGWDSSTTKDYSLDALAFYVAEDLLPKFLDPNLSESYKRLHGSKPGTIEDFTDIFHVKIIRHDKPKRKKKKHRRRTKRGRNSRH